VYTEIGEVEAEASDVIFVRLWEMEDVSKLISEKV